MKRFLSLILTLTLAIVFVGISTQSVEATDAVCTTNKTVFVHYHRWDETYTDTTIHTWGYGTNGSGAGAGVSEVDGFGAVYQICVDDADAGDELGLILKYGDGWSGDDFTDRDGLDLNDDGNKENKAITIKADDAYVGFDENGIKHVYVFEGSNEVLYGEDANSLPHDPTLATIAVIYYDGAESYEGWNVWTWDTGTLGTQSGDAGPYEGSGVPLTYEFGVDGGQVGNFRVAFIQVDPADMGTEIGFIMRTDSWEKKNAENIMIPTTGLVAGDFMPYFYIAGDVAMIETFVDFDAAVNFFEISSATALDPTSIELVFNKDIVTAVDDVVTFDETTIVVTDKDDVVVPLTSISFNSTADVNDTFTIITEDSLLGSKSDYTVTYTPEVGVSYEIEFSVDSTPPVITIIGSVNVEKELGDTYSLPTFSAADMVGEESVEIYNVMVKAGHGTVDTRNAGVYEVVITATDKFGNVAEETITVTVTDPCDDTAHLQANSGINSFLGLLIALPLVVVGFVTLRRSI